MTLRDEARHVLGYCLAGAFVFAAFLCVIVCLFALRAAAGAVSPG